MAIRIQDLPEGPTGAVVAFPTAVVRARARRRQRVELARRRLAVAVVVLVSITGFLFTGGVGASAPVSVPGAPRTVTLYRGQTLWGVADRFAPDDVDPRAYVDALIELNELDGPVVAGTRLKLPR